MTWTCQHAQFNSVQHPTKRNTSSHLCEVTYLFNIFIAAYWCCEVCYECGTWIMCNLFVRYLLQHYCNIREFVIFLTPKPSTGIYMNGTCLTVVIFYTDLQLWKRYRKKDVEKLNVKLARWFVCRKKWSCYRMLCVTLHML